MRGKKLKKVYPLQEYRVTASLYGFWVRILMGGTYDEMQEFLKTHHAEGFKVMCNGEECEDSRETKDFAGMEFYVKEGSNIVFYVWCKDYDLTVLAHELFHTTFELLQYIGMTYTSGGEEAYNYLFEDLLQQATRLMFKIEPKPRKMSYKLYNKSLVK